MLDDLRSAIDGGRARLTPFAARVALHETIGSTNDEAARLAGAGTAEGTVVIADAQTSGRGRSGRVWLSPPGAGVYVSVVLRPRAIDPHAPGMSAAVRLVTLAAGVAIAEGVRAATGLAVEIKWPNDIIVRDQGPSRAAGSWRKLAGILTEASATGAEVQHVIVGYGINVRAVIYPPALAGRITSLEAEAGRPLDRGHVLVETLAALRDRYTDLSSGRDREVIDRWRSLSPTSVGARVTYQRDGRVLEGMTAGLTDEGALAVRAANGIVERVVAGEIGWT